MSNKYTFRLATTSDVEGIRAIYGPVVENTVTSFEMEVPSLSDMENRVTSTLTTYPWIVACINNTVAGYAYGCQLRSRAAYSWSAETSVYIHPDHIGQGLGKQLYTKLFALLEAQGFKNAFAGSSLPNPGSVHLHTKMGFKEIGVYENIGYKNGVWVDVIWWQRPIGEKSANNAPPIPLPKWLEAPQNILLLEKIFTS